MHYHIVFEQVLLGEVELVYVQTDRLIADIFTKPRGLDKLWHFFSMLGLQHLDMPNFKGEVKTESRARAKEMKSEKPTVVHGTII